MGLDGTGWDWMGLDGTGWDWMGLDGTGWDWMGLDGTGWDWMGLLRGGLAFACAMSSKRLSSRQDFHFSIVILLRRPSSMAHGTNNGTHGGTSCGAHTGTSSR